MLCYFLHFLVPLPQRFKPLLSLWVIQKPGVDVSCRGGQTPFWITPSYEPNWKAVLLHPVPAPQALQSSRQIRGIRLRCPVYLP